MPNANMGGVERPIDLTQDDDDIVIVGQEVEFVGRKRPSRPLPTTFADYASTRRNAGGTRSVKSEVQEVICIDDDSDGPSTPSTNGGRAGPSRPIKRTRREDSSRGGTTGLRTSGSIPIASSSHAPGKYNIAARPQVLPTPPPRPPSPVERYFHDFQDEDKWKHLPAPKAAWAPEVKNDNDSEDDEIDEDYLTFQRRRPLVAPPWPNYHRPLPPPGPREFNFQFVPWSVPRITKRTQMRRGKVPFIEHVDFSGLKETESFNDCPGAILRIAQSEGNVVIGGACDGGRDDANGPTDPGSLQAWNSARGRTVLDFAHREEEEDSDAFKYYAINDVKFVPGSSAFVASGYDHRVRIVKEVEGQFRESRRYKLKRFPGIPHDIIFKGNTATFAVGEQDLHVFTYLRVDDDVFLQPPSAENSVLDSDCQFQLAPPTPGPPKHVVGAFRWGAGATSNHLFASTEPSPQNPEAVAGSAGFHHAIDPSRRKPFYVLDAKEAGDAMALNAEGDILALATRASNNIGILRLYDVRNKNGKAQGKIKLEPYGKFEAEVHDMAFSPGGLYLALARQDDEVHVYDARDLFRGPLYRYKHDRGIPKANGTPSAGVNRLEWVESYRFSSSRIGLVTGGSDGCVRLWNPLTAQDSRSVNGTVLVKLEADVATFSLGNRFNWEHKLIVGGGTGEVRIYDRVHFSKDSMTSYTTPLARQPSPFEPVDRPDRIYGITY